MTVKERPILFSGPMVRALLDGSKTQTRRVMKKQPYISRTNPPQFSDVEVGDLFICPDYCPTTPVRGRVIAECESIGAYHCMGQKTFAEKHSPYGVPGDRLWVRESGVISKLRGTLEKPGLFRHDVPTTPTIGHYWVEETRSTGASYNVAGCPRSSALLSYGAKACPSIHMPRWASRITLEVTGVRVERLQDISEADAAAEGVESLRNEGEYWKHYLESTASCDALICLSARESFRTLWDSLAALGADWQANPWVWVVEFKRVT
jgi:hypothetical protein